MSSDARTNVLRANPEDLDAELGEEAGPGGTRPVFEGENETPTTFRIPAARASLEPSVPASAERAPVQGHAVLSIRQPPLRFEPPEWLLQDPVADSRGHRCRLGQPSRRRRDPRREWAGLETCSVGTSPPEVKNRARLRAIVAKLSSRPQAGAGRALRRASDPLSWVEDTSSRNAARTSGRPSTGRASTRRQPPDPASPSGCRNAGSGS